MYSPTIQKPEFCYIESRKENNCDDSTYIEIQRIVQESKEREDRIRKKLDQIRDQAKLVSKKKEAYEEYYKSESSLAVQQKLSKCESQLNSFKGTLENILNLSQKTNQEIKSTKGIVENIQADANNPSNHCNFISDADQSTETKTHYQTTNPIGKNSHHRIFSGLTKESLEDSQLSRMKNSNRK